MAEENENIVEEVQTAPEQVEQPKAEQPRNEQGQFKSKFETAGDDSVAKVALSKPPVEEDKTLPTEPVIKEDTNVVEEIKPEPPIENITEELPVLEEITVDDLRVTEAVEEKIEEAVIEAEETGKPLPENIQKLVDFMDETGGDIKDYVNLK